jgi:CRP-like cAMP-binding protein
VELEEIVGAIPLFESLSLQDRAALAAKFVRRRYRRGEPLFRQGDPAQHLFLIESGRVKISSVSEDGRELVVAVLGPGEVVGELSLFEGGVRTADARAMEEASVHSLSHDVFREYVFAAPRVAWELMRILADRLLRAGEAVVSVVSYDVPGRVARVLLDLAERHGRPAGDGLRIDVPLSQEEIAQMVGSSRESVNKAVASFMDRGWVALEGRNYLIREPEALRGRLR